MGGWRIAPLVQIQTGLPYTPSVSVTSARSSRSTSPRQPSPAVRSLRPHNLAPRTWPAPASMATDPVRTASPSSSAIPTTTRRPPSSTSALAKTSSSRATPCILDRLRFEVFAELFNVMNHQNITGLTTEAYTLSSVNGVPTLAPVFQLRHVHQLQQQLHL